MPAVTQNVDAGGTLLTRATGTLGYRDVATRQGLAAIDSLAAGLCWSLFASGCGDDKYRAADRDHGRQRLDDGRLPAQ